MAKWKRSGADALREYEQSSNYVGSIGVTPLNERSTSEAGGKWKRSGADALREYEQSSSFPQTLQVRKYNAKDRNYDQFADERYSAQVNAQRRDTNRHYQEQVNAAAQAFDTYRRYSSSGAAKNAAHQNYEDAKYRQELARQQMSGKHLTPAEQKILNTTVYRDPAQAAAQEAAKNTPAAKNSQWSEEREQKRREQLSEQEFNRSGAMQEQYGSYDNYLRGVYAGYDEAVARREAEQAKTLEDLQAESDALQTRLDALSDQLKTVYQNPSAESYKNLMELQQQWKDVRKQKKEADRRVSEKQRDEKRSAKQAAQETAQEKYSGWSEARMQGRLDELNRQINMALASSDGTADVSALKTEREALEEEKRRVYPTAWQKAGRFLEDAGTAFYEGGNAQAMSGLEMAHNVAETKLNRGAAWALRDIANSATLHALGGDRYAEKLRSLADRMATEYDYTDAQALQDDYNRIMGEVLQDHSPAGTWVLQQLPSAGAMAVDLMVSTATGGAINPMAAMGIRAGGNAMLDAHNAGATGTQALLIGLQNAAVEVLSEKLFGGNPVYDEDVGLVNKAVSKLTKSKTVMKVLDSKAFDFASEGLEEVVAELLEPTFQSLVLKGTLKGATNAENIGNAFLGGVFLAALGNLAGLPGGLTQAKQERQTKYYAKILAEQGAQSENADVREAASIVQEKLDYGRTPDMEDLGRVLSAMDDAGETQAAQAAADAAQESTVVNTNPSVAEQSSTVKQTDASTLSSMAQTLGKSGQKAIFKAYDSKTDTAEYAGEFVKVYNAARAGNDLPETKTLEPWQRYAAEVAGKNDMDSAPQTTREAVETPFKPGLDYSDYVKAAVRDGEMTTETAQQIDTVAKQLGVRVRFADEVAGGTANAELSGNEVLIEKHNNNPVMFLLGHELTHRIQETAPEQYQQFREAIIDEIRPQAQSVMENYAQRGFKITEEAALDEAAADYAGRMIDDGEVLDDFIEKHRDDRTLLQKIIDAIRSFIRKLTGAERKKAETAEGKLLAAMDAAAENVKKSNGLSGTSSGETRYVIKKDAQGNEFVDAPIWALDVKSQKDVGAALSELVRTKFNSWIDVYGQKIGINQKTANEWTFSKDAQNLYRKNKPAYADKVNAFGVADELLQASRDYVGEEIKHTRKDSFREFARGTVNFRVGANGYSADVVVGTTKNGAAVLYDIVDIQPIKITEAPNTTLAAQGATDRRLDASDNPIVYANSENVNGKLSVKGAEVSREYADVLKENELLKERVDYWKGQTKRTDRATTNEKSVSREAASLVKRYGAELDAADIQGDLQSLYDAMANGELDGKEAFSQAKEIAGKLVENAVEADDELYQSYKDLRNFLRTTKLTISEEDGKNVPDLAELRKRNFGRMTIGKGQTNIDQVYQELADQWPEFFDEDAVSHPADQLQQIADVLGNIYTITEQNPYQGYMEQAKTAAANEILDDFFELPQTRKTFADRQAAALSEAKAKGKAQAQKVREQKNAQLADLREKNRARVNSILEKERTRRTDQINKLKEQYKSRDTAAKDRREARELRNKIIRHTKGLSQKLLRPTDKQHIPEILKHEVAAMLESINMEDNYTLDFATIREGKIGKDGKPTLYGDKLHGADRNEKGVMTRRSEAFEALKAKYTQIVKDGDAMTVDPYLLGDNSEGIRGGFDEVIAMKDTPLADLSKSQLQTVWNVVRAVEHSVSTYGKMLSNAKYAQTRTWAEAIRNDVSERRPIRKRTTRLTLDLETPYTFFSHYGDAGKAIYRMLRDAQDQQQLIVDRITEETQKIVDPKTVKHLEKQTHTFQTASGKTLTLTTAQAMEIYNLMQRKQALEHLTTGGIIQPEIKSAKIGRGFEAIRLTEADLQQIAGSLTTEQVKIADGLQGLTTGLLADYGNDASMRAYGYKKFTEKNYWPIRSAREGVQSTVEKGGNQPRSIQNVGLAKPLTPGANNPLDIPGIFTTFANHAAEMTDYAAWLCTMEDANHLFNYQFRDENGLPTGRNIRQILDEYGGRGAQSYWRSLMDNIQNGINLKEFGPMTDFAGKAISGFKGAAVGGNIRVVIQQPTAFFRAAAVLDPADMAKGLVKGVKGQGGWSRALEYSPIAMRKDNGGFDISAPYTMKETLFDTRTAVRKLNDTLSAPAGAADAVTWGRLWNACEWTVHRENPYLEPGSKAFYEQTAKQFAEVIDQTQVVDGVLQRSNIMRNKGEIAKQATSFMGEPIMSLNLLIRSWDNIRYEQEPRKRGRAIKTFGRAVMALVVTAAVNAMAQSLIDAIRDDDPDKDYKERYMAAFTGISGDEETTWQKAWNAVMEGNLGGNLNYVGNIPYVKDFLSLLQGYEVNRMDTEVVGDLVDAGKMFVQNVDGNGTKTSAYAVKSLLGAASKVYGIPVNNLTRDLWGMVRSVAVETKNIPVQYEMEKAIYNITNNKNKSRYISILYRALEQGDVDSFQHIRSDLMNTMGLDGAEIDESLRSRYNKAVKKDPAYTLPQAARDLIGSRDKYKEETTDEKFSAKDLNETQYLAYSDQRATDYREIEDALKGSDTYQSLDAKTRSKLIEAAYDLVEQQSLEDHSDGQYEITTKWMTLADDAEKIGIEPYMYVTFHVVYNTTESTKGSDGKTVKGQSKSDKIRKWLKDNRDLTEPQRKFLWEAVYESDW